MAGRRRYQGGEEPTRGDPGRATRPKTSEGGDNGYFLNFNSNKRSVTLNLKQPRGKKIFLDLVKLGDIVAENMGPKTLDRLGLGYDVLSDVNPRIILAPDQGFWLLGPLQRLQELRQHRPGYWRFHDGDGLAGWASGQARELP